MARNRHENYIVRTLNGLAYGYFGVVFGIILKQIGTAVHINMLYQWGIMLGYLMDLPLVLQWAYVLMLEG
ncbi:MAG: hypothetical protein ACLUIS_11080 [Longibaculum sp.]